MNNLWISYPFQHLINANLCMGQPALLFPYKPAGCSVPSYKSDPQPADISWGHRLAHYILMRELAFEYSKLNKNML